MKQYIVLISLVVLFTELNSSCSGRGNTQKDDHDNSAVAIEVERAIVEEAEFDETELLPTTLQANAKNNISSQAGGRLSQLYVQVGDRVARGQVIARLDATQLSTAQIQVQDARLNAQRMEELYKIGGISKQQWEQACSSLSIAEQQLSNIRSNTVLCSPIEGFVVARNYDSGDLTSPTTPIVVVEQITPVKAIINISERLFAKVKKGMKASLQTEALGERNFEGYISNIYPSVDARTHSLGVEVEFPNRDLQLRPGMYGRIHLSLGERKVLVVPDRAIQRSLGAGVRYVYVIKEGKVLYRQVELGVKQGSMQEVTSGLKLGEEVVLTGFAQLSNGKSVK